MKKLEIRYVFTKNYTRMSELEKFNNTTYPTLLKKHKLQEVDKIKREK